MVKWPAMSWLTSAQQFPCSYRLVSSFPRCFQRNVSAAHTNTHTHTQLFGARQQQILLLLKPSEMACSLDQTDMSHSQRYRLLTQYSTSHTQWLQLIQILMVNTDHNKWGTLITCRALQFWKCYELRLDGCTLFCMEGLNCSSQESCTWFQEVTVKMQACQEAHT